MSPFVRSTLILSISNISCNYMMYGRIFIFYKYLILPKLAIVIRLVISPLPTFSITRNRTDEINNVLTCKHFEIYVK